MNIKKLFSTKTSNRRMSNILFDYHNNQRGKVVCSRSTLTWILVSVLLTLFLLVINYFLYPSDDPTILVREEPIKGRIIPSRLESAANGENHPDYANPGDFEFRRDPVHLCDTINSPNSVEYQRNPEVKLLILVKSAAVHFEERKAIRSTWGSVGKRPLGPVRLGFVLDNDYWLVSDNETIEFFIYQESSQFKDIIQFDFVESFQTLATKSFLMLKWVAKMCPQAQYFLKTEDDTFVNIHSVADILNKEPYISEDRFIAGHFKSIELSLKLPLTEIIPNLDNSLQNDFSPYATSSYVMSIQTAIDLFGAIKEVKPMLFPEDDALLTGVFTKHIDVLLIHEPSFIIENPPMPPLWDIYSTLTTAHSVPPDALKQVWEDMTKSISNTMYYFETAINTTGSFKRKKSV